MVLLRRKDESVCDRDFMNLDIAIKFVTNRGESIQDYDFISKKYYILNWKPDAIFDKDKNMGPFCDMMSLISFLRARGKRLRSYTICATKKPYSI